MKKMIALFSIGLFLLGLNSCTSLKKAEESSLSSEPFNSGSESAFATSSAFLGSYSSDQTFLSSFIDQAYSFHPEAKPYLDALVRSKICESDWSTLSFNHLSGDELILYYAYWLGAEEKLSSYQTDSGYSLPAAEAESFLLKTFRGELLNIQSSSYYDGKGSYNIPPLKEKGRAFPSRMTTAQQTDPEAAESLQTDEVQNALCLMLYPLENDPNDYGIYGGFSVTFGFSDADGSLYFYEGSVIDPSILDGETGKPHESSNPLGDVLKPENPSDGSLSNLKAPDAAKKETSSPSSAPQ